MQQTRLWQAARWKSTLGILLAAAFAAALLPRTVAGDPASQAEGDPGPGWPVILISVDTLRADRLGCYGARDAGTPHIDSLAGGGTEFLEVSSQVPLTLPSHVSMLTSTYPFASGIEDNGQQLPPGSTTLAGVLKSRGYQTAAFVGAFVLDRRFGLAQGFDTYDSPFDNRRAAGLDPGDVKRLGEDVTGDAERWLAANGSRRFFLFLHLYDLHTPYVLPERLRARYGKPAYDSELRYVDDVVGEFIAFLKARGWFDQALIVFTSDHGESLGEHGESTHGYFIYQSTLRIPWIIHWPRAAAVKPSRVAGPVSLLDVAPTILESLRIPSPPQFQGRGVLGLAQGRAASAEEEIYSESLYPRRHFGASALRSLRRGSIKYIQAPRPELYDLGRDPGERHNLYTERKPLAAAFHQRLASLLSRYGAPHPAASSLPPDVVERLNSLGYAAVSSAGASPPDSGPDPKDRVQAYEQYGRALVLSAAGKLTEANSVLQALLIRFPGLADVRLALGLDQQKLGRHQDAARTFQQALKSDPASALAHFDLAVSELALHRQDDAIRELELALAIEPYYTRAEDALARALIDQRKFDQARAHFEHVLALDPSDYAAHYNLGVLATLEERWTDAERHLTAALAADPESEEAHNTLGSLYLRRRDLDRAQAEFAKALELYPKSAASHYNLGLVLHAKGRDDDAAREFRRALSADPQFKPAREALSRLEAGSK